MPKKEIYLDNAAATPVDPRVAAAMTAALRQTGNPSSFNEAGRRARQVVERARADVARFLNARPNEIVFCASGSEANNLAILGAALAAEGRRRHIVATAIEHRSVLEPVRRLMRQGWKVSTVPVDGTGRVTAEDAVGLLTAKTVLVSVMYANNEVGAIQPIKRIAKAIREWRNAHRTPYPYLHADACQAAPWLPMDVQALGVDLLSINGAKVHGPRGVAALFVRRGVALEPQVMGGSQEHGLRAGTEDVAGAVGLARALSLIKRNDGIRVARLRDRFLEGIPDVLPDARINGPVDRDRLPSIINVSIPGCTSEELLLELDRHGIRAGSGAACTAHSVEPSYVLKAIGTPRKHLGGVVRFSLSRDTTKTDMDRVAKVLPEVVERIQKRYHRS